MKVMITPEEFKRIRDLEAQCWSWSDFNEGRWRDGIDHIIGDRVKIPPYGVPGPRIELVVDWSPCRTCRQAPCRCLHPLFSWETDKSAKRRNANAR